MSGMNVMIFLLCVIIFSVLCVVFMIFQLFTFMRMEFSAMKRLLKDYRSE